MSNKILITGGAGFIGSNFVHLLLAERPEWQLVCLDSLTYAGNLANLAECQGQKQFQFVKGNICDAELVDKLISDDVEVVVNFAAESHVDRSILGCQEFIRTNIEGTQVLMDAARKHEVGKFVQVSTDEVYGSLGEEGAFSEQTPLAPNSPYSASKAAADMLARAYYKTYGFGVITTRCSNNY
ncbi:MAG: GDP-mannose 4,6-dehydratase, partial [Phycisphaerae bacterium]|nr:GDP-mannose 4,6-dehydratase [Phycisphaerae bacterium]